MIINLENLQVFGKEIFLSLEAASIKALILSGFTLFLLKAFRVRSARMEHLAWLIVLCGMLALPFVSFITDSPFSFAIEPAKIKLDGLSRALTSVAETERNVSAMTAFKIVKEFCGGIYLLGLGVTIFRFIKGWLKTQQLLRGCEIIESPQITELSGQLIKTSFFRRRIKVFSCDEIVSPVTTGFFRPKILLPADWGTWEDLKIKSVMAHELAHVRRKDYLVLLLSRLNKCINWFNPLSWAIERRISELAENISDSSAISFVRDSRKYAAYLLELAAKNAENSKYININSLTMVRRKEIVSRINSILQIENDQRREGRFSKLLIGAFCFCLLLGITVSDLRIQLPPDNDCPFARLAGSIK